MGGGIGKDASVRWRIRTGSPKYESSKNPEVKEKVQYNDNSDKENRKLVKEAMGFDAKDEGPFTLRLRLPEGTTPEKFLNTFDATSRVWTITLDDDGKGGDQIEFSWGDGKPAIRRST